MGESLADDGCEGTLSRLSGVSGGQAIHMESMLYALDVNATTR
jgi:hypothetical protein